MRLRDRLANLLPSLRVPGRTIRLRLTIIYAGLFLASGAGLLAITYVLVREAQGDVLIAGGGRGRSVAINDEAAPQPSGARKPAEAGVTGQLGRAGGPVRRVPAAELEAQLRHDRAVAKRQRSAEQRQLLEKSGIALAIMAAASIGLGWVAAGRVLRPLRTINERARAISATNLHKRLALAGPRDELTELAGTFDDLLDRLEGSFQAQRQFVANASHELRTPLARAQTLAEVALSDPEATVDSLRASHGRVLAAGRQQERLIEALLTLARSERGLDHREPFDLAAITTTTLRARLDEVQRCGLAVNATLEPAETSGDPRLAERLVANLIDNAVRYNQPHGHVDITTTTRAGRAVLSVANSGPIVPPDDVTRLLEPFQRHGTDRTDHSDGLGLGLSIVTAIATAHGATLAARAQPEGGLVLEVEFLSVAGGGPANGIP
jgi:signal transduction histidine kinase